MNPNIRAKVMGYQKKNVFGNKLNKNGKFFSCPNVEICRFLTNAHNPALTLVKINPNLPWAPSFLLQ